MTRSGSEPRARTTHTAAGREGPDRQRLAERYDALLIDLDGVVYRGDQAIPAAKETLPEIRRLGGKVLFITNNSARTPTQVAEKLRGLGIEADQGDVLTSAMATAAMLRREDMAGRSAFVIGERGIREALEHAGIELLDGEPQRADVVVVGWDRGVDYAKLRTAALLVERGARLVATNADASYPAQDGLWPGAGAILAAITTTTGARPVIVGKPARPLFEAAAEVTGAVNPLVVGDRLDTDVGGAASMGWDSLLVFSGAASVRDLPRSPHLPTYLGPDLSTLLERPPPARVRPATRTSLPCSSSSPPRGFGPMASPTGSRISWSSRSMGGGARAVARSERRPA
jgi:glycerol 3-phosphatase-2